MTQLFWIACSMTDTTTQFLAWDTQQLGLAVAKIIPTEFDQAELSATLNTLRQQHIKLVYWVVPESAHIAIAAAKQQGGICVDHKVTYLIDLRDMQTASLNIETIQPYPLSQPNDALIQLAYESGKYSRFRNDPHLTETQFQAVYKTWMINSALHKIADDVLVVRNAHDDIVGMITLGEKNQRGDIGLLAVAESARGQQCGKKLVHAAQQYFIEKSFAYSQVVTQQENIPACKLYEKCGYAVEKVEYFFHFWL